MSIVTVTFKDINLGMLDILSKYITNISITQESNVAPKPKVKKFKLKKRLIKKTKKTTNSSTDSEPEPVTEPESEPEMILENDNANLATKLEDQPKSEPEPVVVVEPEPVVVEPEPVVIVEPEPEVIQTKIEKEVQLEEDKEILINNLRKEHMSEVKKLQIKCTNPAVRIKRTKELNKKLNDCIEKIIKRKTLPKIAPTLNDEVVEIETTINIEKHIEIAIETHNKILDTRARIYRIIDNAGEETKETTNLRGTMEKLTRRLLDVKKALTKAGYSPRQIQFRKEIIIFDEGKD